MLALQIFTEIILPVFLLIGVGVLVDHFLKVDLDTIARLTFYVFISAVVFIKLLETDLDPTRFGEIVIFNLVHMALMLAISWKAFSGPLFLRHRPLLAMDTIFFNSGNFGIPFAQLAFGSLGVSVMTIILAVQLIANFTVGLWLVGVGQGRRQDLAAGILKAPVVWMIALALLLRGLHVSIPLPIHQSISYLADGMIPVALLVLGVQLSRSRVFGNGWPLTVASLFRLVISPLVAAGMVLAWNLIAPGQPGALGPILITCAGLPVAVNVYILAIEYGKDPELSSQSIFWTTLLSGVTLTAILAFMRSAF